MTVSVVLDSYLWVPKSALAVPPPVFAPGWEYRIELLKTPEGRLKQQQISVLRQQAEASGLDPDEFISELTAKDHLLIKNWSEVGNWWALCAGDMEKVQALCRQHKWTIKDKRVEPPWPDDVARAFKLVLPPKPNQVGPFQRWLKAGHGILEAATAFGKTYVMIWLLAELKQRALVLTHTDALADQFMTRVRHGSPRDDGGFNPITNCLVVEEKLGIEVVGRYRDPDTLFPITVATYQSFISPGGKKALKKLKASFGIVLCDEAHIFAAPAPAAVVNGFAAKRKSGATATPERKDKLDVALYDVLGQVTAKGISDQLPISATMISTDVAYKGSKYPRRGDWAYLLNYLYKQANRNDLIIKWVEHDVRHGRNLLLLADRVRWCLDMAETLTKEHGIPAKAVIGGMSSKKGIEQRNGIIQSMMDGEIRVICATQVFKLGVDIPILDTLYGTGPMANAPLLRQMLGRIRRLYKGKKDPIFRYFVDEGHGLLYGCAKSTHKSLIEEGADVTFVTAGTDPEKVTMGAQAEEGHDDGALDGVPAGEPKRRGTLKAAAARSPSAVRRLFTDLKEEARLTKQYNERMGNQGKTK